MPNTPQPLVAVDIDGVLNPHPVGYSHPALDVRLPGYVEHDIALPASTRYLPYLRGNGVETVTGRVLVNDAHGRWIRSLLDGGVGGRLGNHLGAFRQ